LLVNKVGKNSNVTINGVAQSNTAYSGYASKYIASSLIGDVGYDTARAISLRFTNLKLDGRSAANSIGNMDTVYGTTKSLFSRATILNSFTYAGESSGSYNFEIERDWSGSTAVHNVTYGHELTNSVEYANKQKMYYGSETYYTHPTVAQSTAEYDFSSGFMPYVYHAANATTAYNLANKTHELMVNVNVTAVIEGCGKYNDPYIIDNNDKLPIIAKIIANDTTVLGGGVQIYLPSDLTGNSTTDNATNFNYVSMDYNNVKYKYSSGTDKFTRIGTNVKVNTTAVRRYLAGAYYIITTDIELPADYIALGTVDAAANTQYAFRGQLIGYGSNITITNHSDAPLINTSMGCVVKGLTVNVDVNKNSSNVITLAAPLVTDAYKFQGGVQSYGAVIGQILGGDTIIDNTQVVFTNAAFTISTASNTYPRLTPIGGYVGTLFNGGLIFRNMTSANVGLTSATEPRVAQAGYLYINPIIGRVIAGYAFHETSVYRVTSAALNNGDKNYTIPDLSLSETMMTVSGGDVSLPNGQAVYILGAAVNSGACCAPTGGSMTSPNAYPDISVTSNSITENWQAYRAQTTVRAGADYSGVGTTDPTSLPDYTKALDDKYTANGNKIPYILRAYTADDTSCLALCSFAIANGTTGVNITLTGDCDVASGFRGIGSIYVASFPAKNNNSNSNLALYIHQFEGYNKKITLHMRYLEYSHKDNQRYINLNETAGFGLFNYARMPSTSNSNSVRNFTLAGSIFHDVYTLSGGVQSTYICVASTNDKLTNENNVSGVVGGSAKEYYISCGGVFGLMYDSAFYIKNVIFHEFLVEGAKCVGGLVGYGTYKNMTPTTSNIKYDSSAGTGDSWVSAVGGIQAGGLVGRTYEYRLAVDAGGHEFTVNKIQLKSAALNDAIDSSWPDNRITGAGGIIGNTWGTHKVSTKTVDSINIRGTTVSPYRKTSISNLTLTGISGAEIAVVNDTSDPSNMNFAGGLIGSAHDIVLDVANCNVAGISIKANMAGGLVGHLSQKYYLNMNNVTVRGHFDSNNNKTSTITGNCIAGGLFGWVRGRDARYISVSNAEVSDYNIVSASHVNNKPCAAGGLIGYAEADRTGESDSANYIFDFDNIIISGCDITTNYNACSDTPHYSGTGGIIGSSGVSSTSTSSSISFRAASDGGSTGALLKFSGYNILLDSVSLKHFDDGVTDNSTASGNRKIGDIIGNNGAGMPIKFVGVTVQNDTYCGKHAGYYNDDNENYGSGNSYGAGYVVFADFGGTLTNQTFGGVFNAEQTLVPFADDYTDVTLAEPYVTTNPVLDIGTQRALRITGDGIGANTQSLPISSIISDLGASGQRKYAYAADARYVSSASTTNKATFDSAVDNMRKFAMFRTEATEYLGADFPVLVLESTDHDYSTKMINSYLRLLTNTQFDFASDTEAAKKFNVKIYRMSYENQHFEPYEVGVSLKRDGETKEFYMHSATFDSGKTQFSLLDVQFYDPATGGTGSEKVAYHLYVPVFVKKILSYNFDIALLSGTTYLSSLYGDYGKALIENVGTP
ncbi:MAG: hypothetical protein J5756_01785, partial [Clostridia bacterium]|nr:hypothetical protein [Clostridia bacterium]